MSFSRRIACIAFALLALAASSLAQSTPNTPSTSSEPSTSQTFGYSNGQNYTKGKGFFPRSFGQFIPREVPKPSYANSSRIETTLKDGKLLLSLDGAIALALENNLDLAISRYNLSIADTEILRTKAGAGTQGVNTGIVQGTLGGSSLTAAAASGGGAGGTSAAAGGAGTGTGGLVTSTLGAGPSTPSFDPVFTSGLSIEHAASAASSPFSGSASLQQNTGSANFGYQQGFSTGTTLALGYNNSRVATNNSFSFFNPSISSSLRIQITQPLLQGLSIATNKRFIRIAKNNREISDVAFRQQVITTVSQIENIYWDLVNAYEDVRAKQRALDLANRLLGDNQKQVQIGTLAPIEVVRAQSGVASAQQDLIVSQTNLQLQQLFIKNAISRNLTDPQLMAAEVIPSDTMQVPAVEPVSPTQDLISDALSHRPELAQAYIDLTNREINNKAAKNSLLPTVNLFGTYGSSALAGQTQLATCPAGANPVTDRCAPAGFGDTGFTDTVSSIFHNNFPDYSVGFNINIPIRNRAAQATQVRSELEYRQAQMRLQQLQNQVRVQVVNAQFTVQQNRARVDAAIKGRQLAAESLDAEQKKYALGASTTYNVMTTQRDLSTAESNLITAMAAYEQSKVALDVATGLLLNRLGIELQDAVSGNVNTMPHVPNVVPSASVTATPMQPATQQAPPQK